MKIGIEISLSCGSTACAATPQMSLPVTAGLAVQMDATRTLWQISNGTTPAVADGDPVGRWDDSSGNARHFGNSVVGERPVMKLAIQNGLPVVRFDGADDSLLGPTLAAITGGTLIAVVKWRSADGGFFASGSGGGNAQHCPYSDQITYEPFGATVRQSSSVSQFDFTTFSVYVVTVGGGLFKSWMNGTAKQSNAATAGVLSNAPRLGCGSVLASYFGAHDVGELLIYSSALSDADRVSVQNYLGRKWGITVA